ncbi:uncharacterized protein LOC106153292 [Lingula anatina]|uniref:Uncharacterized protein LOC106153292 n=1 Tax=Lingula anatina TaxID=7574 RepID=A0A1S3H952_LINAN|nr:uncharacterized protein LOC106153292 [Lingula anatina]|eukprot:XP_013382620.1 uncharacterized protein LOC106153292 [Lingula anatina]
MASKLGLLLFLAMCVNVTFSADDTVKDPRAFCQKSPSSSPFRYACNTCWCSEDGSYFCTEMGCLKVECGDRRAGDHWKEGDLNCTCAYDHDKEGWMVYKPKCQ